jgi:hypothetical protein
MQSKVQVNELNIHLSNGGTYHPLEARNINIHINLFYSWFTKQPSAKVGGFWLWTENPDMCRRSGTSYSGSILKLSFGLDSK